MTVPKRIPARSLHVVAKNIIRIATDDQASGKSGHHDPTFFRIIRSRSAVVGSRYSKLDRDSPATDQPTIAHELDGPRHCLERVSRIIDRTITVRVISISPYIQDQISRQLEEDLAAHHPQHLPVVHV